MGRCNIYKTVAFGLHIILFYTFDNSDLIRKGGNSMQQNYLKSCQLVTHLVFHIVLVLKNTKNSFSVMTMTALITIFGPSI